QVLLMRELGVAAMDGVPGLTAGASIGSDRRASASLPIAGVVHRSVIDGNAPFFRAAVTFEIVAEPGPKVEAPAKPSWLIVPRTASTKAARITLDAPAAGAAGSPFPILERARLKSARLTELSPLRSREA